MLSGKTVILGVTGSIAAYKMANMAGLLKKQHAQVHVIMTGNAANFITPITFETITGNKCLTETFDRNFEYHVAHISLAKKADLLLIAPATANIIAKMAYGLADDMLSTTVLACRCPKVIAPAMNTAMFQNPIVRDNLHRLESYGMTIISPDIGMLACGDVGEGKMPGEDVLMDHVLASIAKEKDMSGLKVLVTAGPTCEAIDPVRCITNHSSGKMGFAIAYNAMLRGADVTLVAGKTALTPPPFVKTINVASAQDMYDVVMDNLPDQDIIIKSAAVADYRPTLVHDQKVKKTEGDLSLDLERTQDILSRIGEMRQPHQYICGFSMETENLLENSTQKLGSKKVDMLVANNLKDAGAGFNSETNVVTIITKDEVVALPKMSKDEVADHLLTLILRKRQLS